MISPAAPNQWHPWYEQFRYSVERWLDDDRYYYLVVPVPQSTAYPAVLYPTSVARMVVLTKHEAYGRAPYTGNREFVYAWRFGVDEFGRQVAGEARIVYMNSTDD